MPFNHPAEARRSPNSQAEYEADDAPHLDPDPSDVLGDAEAYLADYRDHQPAALKGLVVAARVAQRLTAAGRAEEALALLDGAQPLPIQAPPGPGPWIDAQHRRLGPTGAERRGPAIALDVCPAAPIEPASARPPQTLAGL